MNSSLQSNAGPSSAQDRALPFHGVDYLELATCIWCRQPLNSLADRSMPVN